MSEKSLLQYYLQELALLEDDCAAFSAAYPSVAANLGLGSEGTSDSHVRQLIESVAFIAARLKRQIDGASREVALGLLQSLAPQLIAPLPAMSIVRFTPKSPQLEPVASRPPNWLHLQTKSSHAEDIHFTLADRNVALWPLQLLCRWGDVTATQAGQLPSGLTDSDLVLTLEHATKSLDKGAPGDLTFFVSGSLNRAMAAIEALACGVRDIRLMAADGTWSVPLSPDCLQVMGFEPEHRLLPEAVGGAQASGQALELLNFPRRFCFFKIRGLQCAAPARKFHVVLSLEHTSRAALDAVRQNIQLNCVPVLNLFRRGPVALRLKGQRDEYLIPRADSGRGSWDIFSVDRVRLTGRNTDCVIHEFHAGVTSQNALKGEPYWQGVRRDRACASAGHGGLGMRFINLDRARTPAGDVYDTAMLDLMMTQCDAPASLTPGQSLSLVGWESGYQTTLEFAPTPYVEPVLSASARVPGLLKALQWRTSDGKSLTAMVRQFLSAHDRSGHPHASELFRSLEHIDRDMFAMPWPGMKAGALVMGCRYFLSLKSKDPLLATRFLLPRVVRSVLSQTHDLPLPMEVVVGNVSQGGELVR